jgi:hypothetical protein
MDTNRYAPPQAKVADLPSTSHGLKKRRVVVMLVFMVISFGLYYPLWWFRRRPGLNRLNSPKKLAMWPLLLLAAVFVIQIGLAIAAGETPLADVIGAGGVLSVLVFRLAVGILMLVQSFRIKDMIEDHATPDTDSGAMFVEQVQLSGVMTFFFSIFYLQWAINRYVVGTRA